MMGTLTFRFSGVLSQWLVEFISVPCRGDEIKGNRLGEKTMDSNFLLLYYKSNLCYVQI